MDKYVFYSMLKAQFEPFSQTDEDKATQVW